MDMTPTPSEREAMRAERLRVREAHRLKIVSRLEDEGFEPEARRLSKCNGELRLVCQCCGAMREVRQRCEQKHCPCCQPQLAREASDRYLPIVATMRWPIWVTFTALNYPVEEVGCVQAVRRAFTALRRQRWWSRCVVGGVAQLEVTNKGNGWHPHIHALLESRWLSVTVPPPQPGAGKAIWAARGKAAAKEVGAQWALTLGRQASVHVRRVGAAGEADDASSVVRECLKYAVKGDELAECPGAIGPMIRALQKTRQLVSWGSCYRRPELRKPKYPSKPCAECERETMWLPEACMERHFEYVNAGWGLVRKKKL